MLGDARTRTTIDRQTFTITFHRALGAAPARVFEAWTRPEQVREWWDPDGIPLSECRIDLVVGGAFRFVNRDSHHAPPFEGVYREVAPPGRLVFEALGSVGTVLIEPQGAGSRLTVTIRCASAEHLAQFLQLGVDVGTDRTLDNLVAHLGG